MITIDMLPADVIESQNGDGANVAALMGAPLREARETFEREYLRIQIRRFFGQYLSHGQLYRHGTVRAPSQIKAARPNRSPDGGRGSRIAAHICW